MGLLLKGLFYNAIRLQDIFKLSLRENNQFWISIEESEIENDLQNYRLIINLYLEILGNVVFLKISEAYYSYRRRNRYL